MSSDGSETSTGSRIRQFGLYRTIDARTEEFLKSSRKRQIRQGCACAAISTAITVTVVISVILVYEYSIKSDLNGHKRVSIKPTWFGVKNDTDVSMTNLESAKKINLERETLKLLPILLKALNKSRHLEKILNEITSSSPTYETGEPETYFKKNIFSNSKSWLRLPASKLFADNKTPPFIYLQNPSKRLDYLNKIRKIRNYERMLRYFDKTVTEKVINSITEQGVKEVKTDTTRPITTSSHTTSRPKSKKIIYLTKFIVQHTTTTYTPKRNTRKMEIKNITNRNSLNENTSSCSCPKNLGNMLRKLIHSMQELVPNISLQESKSTCSDKKKSKSDNLLQTTKTKITTEKVLIKPILHNSFTKHIMKKVATIPTTDKLTINLSTTVIVPTQSTYYLKELSTTGTEIIAKNQTSIPITTHTAVVKPTVKSSTISSYNPELRDVTRKFWNKFKINRNVPNENYDKPTTIRSKIFSTYSSFLTHLSTRTAPIDVTSSTNNNHDVNRTVQVLGNPEELTEIPVAYTTETTTQGTDTNIAITTSKEIMSQLSTDFAELRRTTELIVPYRGSYMSYNEASSNPENTFDSVAVLPNYKHPIEPLFKDEIYDDDVTTSNLLNNDDKSISHQNYLKSSNCTKTLSTEYFKNEPIHLRNNIRKMVFKSANYHSLMKYTDMNMRKMSELIHDPDSFADNESTTSRIHTPINEKGASKVPYFAQVNLAKSNTKLNQNLMNLQESVETKHMQTVDTDNAHTENTAEEEFQEQLITQRPVSAETMYKKSDIIFNDDETVQDNWDKIKSNDKINDHEVKSMLPPVRPTYLEVHRNGDWKTESLNDYEPNFANNIFDLP